MPHGEVGVGGRGAPAILRPRGSDIQRRIEAFYVQVCGWRKSGYPRRQQRAQRHLNEATTNADNWADDWADDWEG